MLRSISSAHRVVDAERNAVRVAEIELGEVTRQMGFGDVVERPDDGSPLKERENVAVNTS